jgi:PTH1 family peptidyl-tRNA hydrolase
VKIVVGLGNPGSQYEHTPHNVGFAVVESLAARCDCRLRRSFRFKARVGKGRADGVPVLLVQPLTYMNCSGDAVGPMARYYSAEPQDVVVAVDDADLPVGRLRIRARGSSGGHKGLHSIIQALDSDAFTRVRIGVGRERAQDGLVEHVLTAFSPQESERVRAVVDVAAEAVLCVLRCGVDAAMNSYNGRESGSEN